MIEIYNCFPRPPSGRKCRKSVFSKDTTEYREQILNRDHVDHNDRALTTQQLGVQECPQRLQHM